MLVLNSTFLYFCAKCYLFINCLNGEVMYKQSFSMCAIHEVCHQFQSNLSHHSVNFSVSFLSCWR